MFAGGGGDHDTLEVFVDSFLSDDQFIGITISDNDTCDILVTVL